MPIACNKKKKQLNKWFADVSSHQLNCEHRFVFNTDTGQQLECDQLKNTFKCIKL